MLLPSVLLSCLDLDIKKVLQELNAISVFIIKRNANRYFLPNYHLYFLLNM